MSVIVIIAVGDATAKARDAARIADVRQLSFILERETALGNIVELTGCGNDAKTTACNNSGAINDYFYGAGGVIDPGMNFGDGVACDDGVDGPCHYGISDEAGTGIASTDDYRICFYLEIGVAGLGPGLNSIRTGNRLESGCAAL